MIRTIDPFSKNVEKQGTSFTFFTFPKNVKTMVSEVEITL